MTEIDQLLKVDARGRVWTPPERREEILDEFERRGMPGTKFAACIGVKYSTFASWVAARRRQRGARTDGTSPALRWVEAAVEAPAQSGALWVHWEGGARMQISNAAQATLAAALLRELVQSNGSGAPC